MLNIGPQEMLVILLVALLVVGPQRLPQFGRTIGRALRELRKAQDEVRRVVNETLEEPKPGAAASAAPARPTTEPAAADAVAPEPDAITSLADGARKLRKAREEIQRTFRIDRGPRA